jgi:hypothetical protein
MEISGVVSGLTHILLKDYRLLPKVEAAEWVAALHRPNPHIPL